MTTTETSKAIQTLNDAADKLTADFLAGRLSHANYEIGSARLALDAARIIADLD